MMNDDQYKRLQDLMAKISEVHAFKYEGVIYQGLPIDAIKRFLKAYPVDKADFHVWLQNHYPVLSPSNNY